MVENTHAERLALRMRAKIGFEAERVDGRNERFYCVEWRAGNRRVGCHVAAPLREHRI